MGYIEVDWGVVCWDVGYIEVHWRYERGCGVPILRCIGGSVRGCG